MGNMISRKYGVSRRYGVNLWGQAKDPVNSRKYPPGQHGTSGFKKLSDFGKQFAAHKKLKAYYNFRTSRQFKNIFVKAKKMVKKVGNIIDSFTGLLESRLMSVLYRSELASTIFMARQFVSHSHVTVNGKMVNIASYTVKPGDLIKIKKKLIHSNGKKESEVQLGALASAPYLKVGVCVEDKQEYYVIEYLRMPKLSEIPYPIDMEVNLIVEFFSR
ncbi:30S ribosomal protein S4 [Candidatus Mesenet endosymbiont of Agriotes lineatus]|uniref:30S ribosomal protein S4 n=1 Tax=Candidatus Mesenet endosymbiont of Agriotes lineatus TaxID=3077948 RepID=UPI0030CC237E